MIHLNNNEEKMNYYYYNTYIMIFLDQTKP